jgi:hypothetical protein
MLPTYYKPAPPPYIHTLSEVEYDRSNIRQNRSNNSHVNRIRKPISLTNGFRKHVISTFIEAGLNHEIRELLVDHATQLDQYYFRPSQEQVLTEYLKAEPLLTIDSTLRLERENKTLRQEVSRFNRLDREIEELKQKIGL